MHQLGAGILPEFVHFRQLLAQHRGTTVGSSLASGKGNSVGTKSIHGGTFAATVAQRVAGHAAHLGSFFGKEFGTAKVLCIVFGTFHGISKGESGLNFGRRSHDGIFILVCFVSS